MIDLNYVLNGIHLMNHIDIDIYVYSQSAIAHWHFASFGDHFSMRRNLLLLPDAMASSAVVQNTNAKWRPMQIKYFPVLTHIAYALVLQFILHLLAVKPQDCNRR